MVSLYEQTFRICFDEPENYEAEDFGLDEEEYAKVSLIGVDTDTNDGCLLVYDDNRVFDDPDFVQRWNKVWAEMQDLLDSLRCETF